MGQSDDVLGHGDFMVGEVSDIAGHPSGLQSGDHIVIVHQSAAGQVDDAHLSLHVGDGIGVDGALGIVVVGHMDGDIVGDTVKLVDVLDHMDMAIQTQGGIHGQEGVIAIDVHAQFQCGVADQRADGTQTDDTDGLAEQFGTGEGGLALLNSGLQIAAGLPCLLLNPVGAGDDVAGGHQQGAEHQFLDCIGVGAGGVENHDAVFAAALDGDVVGAGTGTGDGAQSTGEFISVHIGRADEDTILVFYLIVHQKTALVQLGQADGGDFVQSLDAVHIGNLL